MPAPHTLKIAEIFAGVQGEGLRLGRPAVFVRLVGCNLRCPFCDTKAAWRGGRAMTAAAVAATVARLGTSWPAGWICLTGGEPFAQPIEPLVERLHADGFRIQVETNGTLFRDVRLDWVTVSPKPPSYDVSPEFFGLANEIKLVVSKELTMAVLRRVRTSFPAFVAVLLQPESNKPESRAKALRLLRGALSEGLADIRLGIQLHRIYGLR